MAINKLIQQTETRQKRIQSLAFVIAVFAAVCFSVCLVTLSLSGSGQSCEIRLDEKINPNDAPMASLVRLPGIGISRAGAIVAYRENFAGQNNGTPAFQTIDDLQKVKGIGPKTAQNIDQLLKFD